MRSNPSPETSATLVDRGFQLAYVCAYRLMRAYWRLRHPETHGTLVAIFNEGEVLLVKNSYVPYYSLPGGYVRRSERTRDAALRELKEEVGIAARPDDLELLLDTTHEWEGKQDHVEIFALEVDKRPKIEIDHREVVEARWLSPEQALKLTLFPPLRQVIEKRISR